MSPSRPLCLCSNFTIGTLAVVMGKMFLRPAESRAAGQTGLESTCGGFDRDLPVCFLRTLAKPSMISLQFSFCLEHESGQCSRLHGLSGRVIDPSLPLPPQSHDPPGSCRCPDHYHGSQSRSWRSQKGKAVLSLQNHTHTHTHRVFKKDIGDGTSAETRRLRGHTHTHSGM